MPISCGAIDKEALIICLNSSTKHFVAKNSPRKFVLLTSVVSEFPF